MYPERFCEGKAEFVHLEQLGTGLDVPCFADYQDVQGPFGHANATPFRELWLEEEHVPVATNPVVLAPFEGVLWRNGAELFWPTIILSQHMAEDQPTRLNRERLKAEWLPSVSIAQ